MGKYEDYKKLVKEAQEYYDNNSKDMKVPMKWCSTYLTEYTNRHVKKTDKGWPICEEINLWTYWQGRGYFSEKLYEKGIKIKYLVVGQDWGNPFNFETQIMKNIVDMNNGVDTNYFDEYKITDNETDSNLINLFQQLSYKDNEKYDIKNKTYDNLFFTNFCLGYRTGKESGGLTETQMKSCKDIEFFRKLCCIIEPENILCLGQNVFDCVYYALVQEKLPYNGSYNKYLDDKLLGKAPLFEMAKCDGVNAKIYGLSHCGTYGVLNRKSNTTNEKGFTLQEKDWGIIQ